MGILLVDRKGAHIQSANRCIEIRVAGELQQRVPLAMLERIVIRADTSITGRAMSELAHSGVGLLSIAGRKQEKIAWLLGAPAQDTQARQLQVLSAHDHDTRATIVRVLVQRKLISQRRLLHRYSLQRTDLRYQLISAGKAIQSLSVKNEGPLAIDSIRGIEGAAARSYFGALQCLFAREHGFEKRQKRPPSDPVNACLSLGYTLLTSEAVNACWKTGLDPMVGYLHVPEHSRPSLACDLIEPWRTVIDDWVVQLFRKGLLKAGDFSMSDGGACLLNKEGRQKYYVGYAGIHPRLDKALLRTCRMLKKYLLQSYSQQIGGKT
jgi:CRISPR-associated protein Cas1